MQKSGQSAEWGSSLPITSPCTWLIPQNNIIDKNLTSPRHSKTTKDCIVCTLTNKLVYYSRCLEVVTTYAETLAVYRNTTRIALKLTACIIYLTMLHKRVKALGAPEPETSALPALSRVVGALTWDLEVAENLARVSAFFLFFFNLSNECVVRCARLACTNA